MTDAGWAEKKVTAECIRDTLREQGNVLSPHVVAQCIDDLLRSATYHQGRVAGLRDCEKELNRLAQRDSDYEDDIDGITEWVRSHIEQAQGEHS